MLFFKNADILEIIMKKNRIARFILLTIGCFIIALVYNAFIVPNNIVYGGLGGVAILSNHLFGFDINLFINIVTLMLVLLSIILLGFKKTSYTIIGFLLYTLMVNITYPIANYFQFEFESFLVSILFYGLIDGVGFGLIFKTGFNTGGSDSIVAIVQKYSKFPTASLSNIINGVIVVVGAMVLGLTKSIYAIIFLLILNFISDRIVLGVSTSKICFIKTRKLFEVEKMLREDLDVGYTLIDSNNGISVLNKPVIMCVVPTDRFLDFKKELLKIDKKTKILSNDCYTAEGGRINKIISV